MKIFLDTADIEAIRRADATGLIDGITTNPTFVSKTGRNLEDLLKEICSIVTGPVNGEAMGSTVVELIKHARHLASIAPNICVKVPMTPDGLTALGILEREHQISTNVTMCFSPSQAFLAMKAGASYVSLVLSRLDAIGHDSEQLVEDAVTIQQQYGFKTEIIAASIKTQSSLLTCLRAGVDIATIPPTLFDQLFQHPLTDVGLEQFRQDWQKLTEGG